MFADVDDMYSTDLGWHVRGVQRALGLPPSGIIDEELLGRLNLL
jgi:hypothetical protein